MSCRKFKSFHIPREEDMSPWTRRFNKDAMIES